MTDAQELDLILNFIAIREGMDTGVVRRMLNQGWCYTLSAVPAECGWRDRMGYAPPRAG